MAQKWIRVLCAAGLLGVMALGAGCLVYSEPYGVYAPAPPPVVVRPFGYYGYYPYGYYRPYGAWAGPRWHGHRPYNRRW